MGVGAAVGAAAGAVFASGAAGVTIATGVMIGFSVGRSYDNYKEAQEAKEQMRDSPTYSFGPIRNTKSHEMPIPIIYGENLVAGNIIYQKVHGENDRYMDVQVGLGVGPLESVTNIKANEIEITPEIKLGNENQTAWSENEHNQSFPYLSYISTTLDAEELEISGVPTITSIIKGLKIDVWDGSGWVNQYSNNNAFCVLDFLKNERYGLGIRTDRIDFESFKEAADYCDGLVDGEKRFELNMVIDSSQSALDILEQMLSTFRGFLFYSEGKLKLKVDRPEAAVQSFVFMNDQEKDNVIEGSFSYQKSSRSNRYSEIIVEYTEPNENFETLGAKYTDSPSEFQNSRSISLLGVNRFSQAGREARYFQKKSKLCTTMASWGAGISDIQAEVGDVVLLTHEVPGWVDKPFRIIEIEENENDEMQITGIEYNEAIYSDDGVVYQPSTGSTLPNPFAGPASVVNLAAVESLDQLKDGTIISNVNLSWNKPDQAFWKAAHVYISTDQAEWEFLQRVQAESYTVKNLKIGNYFFKVVSENRKGRKEEFATAAEIDITTNGKTSPPAPPSYNDYGPIIEGFWLLMDPSPELDWEGYKIYASQTSGFSPGASNLVADSKERNFVINNLEPSTTYYIKSMQYDASGNESSYSAEISITTYSLGDINRGTYGMRITGENGIEVIDSQGDKSVLNSEHLAFYKSGSSNPHWYTKRVARGVASNGEKITLNWDRTPKVVVAISKLMSYNNNYSGYKQYYEAFATEFKQNSFRVYARSIIPGVWSTWQSPGEVIGVYPGHAQTWTSSYSNRTNATRIKLNLQFHNNGGDTEDDWDFTAYVRYQRNGGSWVTHDVIDYDANLPYDGDSEFSIEYDIPNLPAGQYRFQVQVNCSYDVRTDMIANSCQSMAEDVISDDQTEIMYIAIEGGA